MKAIQIGSKYKIYDDSIHTYDKLPAATFTIRFHQMEGFYLIQKNNISVSEKVYGVQKTKIDKVVNSFEQFSRSLGVILSGDKGIGKSMFAKLVCCEALKRRYPVIIVDTSISGIANFIESIDQECVILFDEFDKTFRSNDDTDDQSALLSLFDGTAGGKKLFLVTCNELYGLNNYIVNRPGRFHYHFRFDYPSANDIREYLSDKLKKEYYPEIERVIDFSRKISLNYDCLRAIAFELNNGNDFSSAILDLNIMTTENEEYKVYLFFNNGKSLHELRYRTNLFDYDGSMTGICLYDDDGNYVLKAYFDKKRIRYDLNYSAVIVPAEGIKIDKGSIDEENPLNSEFIQAKPTYMTFTKRVSNNLHYMI